jgi:outer membrane protein, heavy metal efflux system
MPAAQTPSPLAGQAAPAMPLTFRSALELASTRNLGLEAARRQRAIRDAAIQSARLRPNPDVSTETSRDTPHQAFSVDWPVEIGGKRSNRILLAREELSLADIDVQVSLRTMRRRVREAFYSLLASDQRVVLEQQALEIARRLREIAQSRFDTGAAPRLEVLQADLGVARADTDLELARGLQTAERARLNGVLNLPPQQATTVVGSLYDRVNAPLYDQAVQLIATSNTDLTGVDRQIAVEQRRIDLLRSERTPTPIFTAGAVFNAPGEFDAGHRIGVTVGVPLFNRNQGEIAAALARSLQLRAQRDATQRDIQSSLFGVIARLDAQRKQIGAYRDRLVPTATELEGLSEESYRAGRTAVLSVLEAQRTLKDVSEEALRAALDLQLSLAELEELLGTTLP